MAAGTDDVVALVVWLVVCDAVEVVVGIVIDVVVEIVVKVMTCRSSKHHFGASGSRVTALAVRTGSGHKEPSSDPGPNPH
jgi:hypothetical protein